MVMHRDRQQAEKKRGRGWGRMKKERSGIGTTARMAMVVMIVVVVAVVAVVVLKWGPGSFTTTPPTTTTPSEIVLVSYTLSPVSSAHLDTLGLGDVEVTLRNEGNAPAEIYKLILTVGEKEYTSLPWKTLDPQEEADFTIYCWGSVDRQIGTYSYSFTGKLEVQDYDQQTLLKQDLTFTITIPTIGMGDTLPDVGYLRTDNMSFTPLSWSESHTAEADPGMKFVILHFRYQNNSVRVQNTPYIFSGEIATDEGYIYPLDLNRSNDASYEELYQGESVEGSLTFQIPEGATPVEVRLVYIGRGIWNTLIVRF
jgi:hypothetical protein